MEIKPKDKYIEETKSLTQASRDMQRPELVPVCGMEIEVFPEVFNPGQFFSSCWFAEEVSKFVEAVDAMDFCEVGSGTGIVSLSVAQNNPGVRIVSCDVNENAVANTSANLERYGISARATVLQSDVFSGLGEKKFDVIFWALPFGYVEKETELDNVGLQTFDAGYTGIEEYFRSGASHLNRGGTLLFGFSPEIGHLELVEQLAGKYEWSLRLVSEENGTEKSVVKMQVYAATLNEF
jgi:16S rRNA G1207 methylase RsmC